MTLLTWSESLELGVPQVDQQHHRLVDLLNSLDSGVKKGYAYHILGSILSDLVRYTLYHFTFEERLMKTHELPGSDEHKAEHAAFVERVLTLKMTFDTRHRDVGDELLTYLRDWLRSHILGSDREMADAFIAKQS